MLAEHIETKLTGLGFTKEQYDERIIYKQSKQMREHGQVMIVNGHKQEMPGQVFNMEFEIDIKGEGWVENNDEEKIPILFVNFKSKVGDNVIVDYFEGLYLDRIEDFDKIINQIYR